MKVTLSHCTPLYIASDGARTCWQSHDKSDTTRTYEDVPFGNDKPLAAPIIGPKDLELLDRVGNKFKHASVLEHVSFNFYIEGISRACLQELARHRMASLSVKSSRYTLKELKDEAPFLPIIEPQRVEKYLVMTGVESVDMASIQALENLRIIIAAGTSNDKAKYCMPEAYKTELAWSINLRSLQNFLLLRTDKSALWEIRELANAIYCAIPKEHKTLLVHCIKQTEVE